FWPRGVVSNTSRLIDVTIGVIISARINPAVNIDRPFTGPPNSGPTSGSAPSLSLTLWYGPTMAGASTRMPHNPNTTEGTAASRSTTYDTGLRSRLGATSVRNSAMPRLTGTASASAIAELTNVP